MMNVISIMFGFIHIVVCCNAPNFLKLRAKILGKPNAGSSTVPPIIGVANVTTDYTTNVSTWSTKLTTKRDVQAKKEFFVIQQLGDWSKSNEACLNRSAALASLESIADLNAASAIINGSGTSNVWISTKKQVVKISGNDWKWIDNSQVYSWTPVSMWYGPTLTEQCMHIKLKQSLTLEPCGCNEEKALVCRVNRRWVVQPGTYSFQAAVAQCQGLGGNVATFTWPEDLVAAASVIIDSDVSFIWAGITTNAVWENKWVSLSGLFFNFTGSIWIDGKPNGEGGCMELMKTDESYRANDVNCLKQNAALCQSYSQFLPPPISTLVATNRPSTALLYYEKSFQGCNFPYFDRAYAIWPMDSAFRLRDIVQGTLLQTGGEPSFYANLGPFGTANTSLSSSLRSFLSFETRFGINLVSYWVGFFVRTSYQPDQLDWPVIELKAKNTDTDEGDVVFGLQLDRKTSSLGAALILVCRLGACFTPISRIPYDQWIFISFSYDHSVPQVSLTTSLDGGFSMLKTENIIFTPQFFGSNFGKQVYVAIGKGLKRSRDGTINSMTVNDAMSCLGIYPIMVAPEKFISSCACLLSNLEFITQRQSLSTSATLVTPSGESCTITQESDALALWPMNSVWKARDLIRGTLLNTTANFRFFIEKGPFGFYEAALTAWSNSFALSLGVPIPPAADFWIAFFARVSFQPVTSNWPIVHIVDGFNSQRNRIAITAFRNRNSLNAELRFACQDMRCFNALVEIPYDTWFFVCFGYDSELKEMTVATSFEFPFHQFSHRRFSFVDGLVDGWLNDPKLFIGYGPTEVDGKYQQSMTTADAISCLGLYSKSWIDPASYVTFCSCSNKAQPSPITSQPIWWRCYNVSDCSSTCRSGISATTANPCSNGELPEVTPTPFDDSYQNCVDRKFDYPYGNELYKEMENKSWTIQTCSQQIIRYSVDFVQMDSCESGWDILSIYDGSSNQFPLIKRFSQQFLNKNDTFDSTSATNFLTFTSDDSCQGLGFKFYYSPSI